MSTNFFYLVEMFERHHFFIKNSFSSSYQPLIYPYHLRRPSSISHVKQKSNFPISCIFEWRSKSIHHLQLSLFIHFPYPNKKANHDGKQWTIFSSHQHRNQRRKSINTEEKHKENDVELSKPNEWSSKHTIERCKMKTRNSKAVERTYRLSNVISYFRMSSRCFSPIHNFFFSKRLDS